MSAAEWDRTPWWEQRLLQEGLAAEQPWIQRAAMLTKVDDPLALRTGVFSDELDHLADDDEAAELAAWGVQIRRSDNVTPLYRPGGVSGGG